MTQTKEVTRIVTAGQVVWACKTGRVCLSHFPTLRDEAAKVLLSFDRFDGLSPETGMQFAADVNPNATSPEDVDPRGIRLLVPGELADV